MVVKITGRVRAQPADMGQSCKKMAEVRRDGECLALHYKVIRCSQGVQ